MTPTTSHHTLAEYAIKRKKELQGKPDCELYNLLVAAGREMQRNDLENSNDIPNAPYHHAVIDEVTIKEILRNRQAAAAGKNLVFLQYSTNSSDVVLREEQTSGVAIDLEGNTWSFRGVTSKIGTWQHRTWGAHGATIGVFDRRNTKHLQSLVIAVQKVTK